MISVKLVANSGSGALEVPRLCAMQIHITLHSCEHRLLSCSEKSSTKKLTTNSQSKVSLQV